MSPTHSVIMLKVPCKPHVAGLITLWVSFDYYGISEDILRECAHIHSFTITRQLSSTCIGPSALLQTLCIGQDQFEITRVCWGPARFGCHSGVGQCYKTCRGHSSRQYCWVVHTVYKDLQCSRIYALHTLTTACDGPISNRIMYIHEVENSGSQCCSVLSF